MNEKNKLIVNRIEAMAIPFSSDGNRVINESPGQKGQRWIEE